jgi:hypothetical protein
LKLPRPAQVVETAAWRGPLSGPFSLRNKIGQKC